MKYCILLCTMLIFLTACPDPDETTDVQPVPGEIDISQVQLTTLVEIKPEKAKIMIDHVRSKEGICDNASADINAAELKALVSAKSVTGVKILRANHPMDDPKEDLRNRPTVLLVVFVGKIPKYYQPTSVCPPPDGSTCVEGLNLPTALQ